MNPQDRTFVTTLVASQARLYAYVVSLLRDPDRAHDVLQRANVVMLQKKDDVAEPARDFLPWALKVCFYEVQAERRARARDRLRLDDRMLEQLAEASARRSDGFPARQQALAACLATLPEHQRDLIARRYAPGGTVESLASALQRPPASVSQTLYRIREALLACMRRRLALEDR